MFGLSDLKGLLQSKNFCDSMIQFTQMITDQFPNSPTEFDNNKLGRWLVSQSGGYTDH